MKIEGAKMEKGDGARGAGPADACRNYRTVIPSYRPLEENLEIYSLTGRYLVLYTIIRIIEVDDL